MNESANIVKRHMTVCTFIFHGKYKLKCKHFLTVIKLLVITSLSITIGSVPDSDFMFGIIENTLRVETFAYGGF